MKMAAAEAPLRDRATAARRSPSSPSAPPTGRRRSSPSRSPACCPSSAPAPSTAKVEGINPLREQYAETYGSDPSSTAFTEGDYTPVIPVTYWSFRFMMGLGIFAAAGAALILWLTRKGRTPGVRWLGVLGLSLPIATTLASSWGWIFTEMGRQPWVVFGLMTTESGVSPGVSVFEAATSLVVLTVALRRARGDRGQAARHLRQARARIPIWSRPASRSAAPTTTTPRSPSPTDLPTGPPRTRERHHGTDHRLVRPDRRPVDRLLLPGGLRLRRRHAAAGARPQRDRATRHDQHDRAGLGRQRGLGARRGRRDLRRLPRVVRHPLQRLLPAAAADPGRA